MISIILCPLCSWENKTMILNVFILVFTVIKSASFSFIVDPLDQDSIHISKYCPKQKYCEEGAHVVCMYYDQNQEFSPHCENPVKVPVTPKMRQRILTHVNDMRGKLATGSEQGKDGEVLPRAYGLMKLEWDKELAFLAQVLANQCLGGREDLCRATDRFPNPSQTIAIVRYKYPNWEYLQPNNTDKGLNEEKLLFALDRFLKTILSFKNKVTEDIIKKCPSFQELPNEHMKYYLNLVRGGATHIGCGVSAYTKYKMVGGTGSTQNNVEIICNISDAPKAKQAVYRTVLPSGPGYSKRCGCPRGYQEIRSCLCERDLKYQRNRARKDDEQSTPRNEGHNHNPVEDYEEHLNIGLKIQTHDEDNDEEIEDDIVDSLSEVSHNAGLEAKHVKNIDSSEESYKIPKNNHIHSRHTHESYDPVIMFTSDAKSKLPPIATADAFEELIFKLQHGIKETAEHTNSKQNHDINNENKFNVKLQNNHRDSKHKRLLSILNSLENEINNVKFDNDLEQLFYSKMRKIYENGLKKAKNTPSPKTHDDQQDNKDLQELRTYLENESDASVEDEIKTIRRTIYNFSKGKHKDHKVNYDENDNDLNQNYNHMDQQFNEFYDDNNMDNIFEDNSRKTALTEHRDSYVKFLDLLNNKHNYLQNYNLHDRNKPRIRKTFDQNNARKTISSKVLDQNLDRSGQRTSFDASVPFSEVFRRKENDELREMLRRRPNMLDMLRKHQE